MNNILCDIAAIVIRTESDGFHSYHYVKRCVMGGSRTVLRRQKS